MILVNNKSTAHWAKLLDVKNDIGQSKKKATLSVGKNGSAKKQEATWWEAKLK